MCKICSNNTKNIVIDGIEYEFCFNCGFLSKTENFILSPSC